MSNKKQESKEVAVPAAGAVVTYDYGDQAGMGLETTTQADVGIPFLNLLQQNSPECTDGHPKRLEGAKSGMFMDGATRELFDPSKGGIVLVPCATQHVYVEWIPRNDGGGFVAIHALDSEVVKKATGGQRVLGKIALPAVPGKNGGKATELVETYYLFALMLRSVGSEDVVGAYVIGVTSKKIKPYRTTIGELYKYRKGVPLFAHQLVLTSVDDQNRSAQHFKNVKLAPALGTVEKSLIPRNRPDGTRHPVNALAYEFWQSVSGGSAKVDYSAGQEDATGPTEDGDTVFQ